MVLGFDPGAQLGVARVDVGPRITVAMTATFANITELGVLLKLPQSTVPPIIIEWWEYQGPKKSRGVPHQAEACGRVAGYLDACGLTYHTITRGEVLSALNLPRNSKKAAVRERIRTLTGGRVPRNDHEADAAAIAIAGANRL